MAYSDLEAAKASAHQGINFIFTAVLFMLIAGLLIGAGTAFTAGRGIVKAEKALQVTLSSIGDAVIATNPKGKVTFLNPVARALTGWREEEAIGKSLETIFNIVNEKTRQPAENPVNMERLFRPFVQLDSALARQHEGTGLGLALVQRLVKFTPSGGMNGLDLRPA